MSDDADALCARLRAVAEQVDHLDRGTRLQLLVALGAALDRIDADNPQLLVEAPRPSVDPGDSPVFPRVPAQPSTQGRGNPRPLVDPLGPGAP